MTSAPCRSPQPTSLARTALAPTPSSFSQRANSKSQRGLQVSLAQSRQLRLQGSPAKILRSAINDRISGRLTIREPQDPSIGWRVYFSNGQLHFADSIMGQQERLSYVLQHHSFHSDNSQSLSRVKSIYTVLHQLWSSRDLSLQDLQGLLAYSSQEALIQILSISKTQLQFEPNVGLDPLLLSIPFESLVMPIEDKIKQWQLMRSDLCSAFQRPYIKNWDKYVQFMSDFRGPCPYLMKLMWILKENYCLYELATQVDVETQELAVALHSLIKCGAVGVRPHHVVQHPVRPLVACIHAQYNDSAFLRSER